MKLKEHIPAFAQ